MSRLAAARSGDMSGSDISNGGVSSFFYYVSVLGAKSDSPSGPRLS